MRTAEEIRAYLVNEGKTAHGVFIHEMLAFIDSEPPCQHVVLFHDSHGWWSRTETGLKKATFCPDCGEKLEKE